MIMIEHGDRNIITKMKIIQLDKKILWYQDAVRQKT